MFPWTLSCPWKFPLLLHLALVWCLSFLQLRNQYWWITNVHLVHYKIFLFFKLIDYWFKHLYKDSDCFSKLGSEWQQINQRWRWREGSREIWRQSPWNWQRRRELLARVRIPKQLKWWRENSRDLGVVGKGNTSKFSFAEDWEEPRLALETQGQTWGAEGSPL